MQLRRSSSSVATEANLKQQQEMVTHLVFAQPMDELDASDTEAEKVTSVFSGCNVTRVPEYVPIACIHLGTLMLVCCGWGLC